MTYEAKRKLHENGFDLQTVRHSHTDLLMHFIEPIG